MMLRKVLSSRRKSKAHPQAHEAPKVLEESNAFICQLPLEIFLAITSQLTYVSRRCLASTCRTLYRLIAQCHPTSLKRREDYLSTRRLVQYWKLWARDLPDYLVCDVHAELYLWRPQHQVGYQCPKSVKVNRYDPVTLYLCYPPIKGYRRWHRGLYITECLRELILRHHVRGPQWGVPVSGLSHKCKGRISPAVYERKDTEGKIVDGRLMVRTLTSHTTRIRRFKYLPVREEVWNAAVCPHFSHEVWSVFKAAIEHLITAQGLREADFDANGNFRPTAKNFEFEKRWYRCSTLLKCPWCAADVRISIRRVTFRETEIAFATYHDFGGFHRNTFQKAMFKKVYHRLYYDVNPPMEEYGERLNCSLENLYEGSQEKSHRGLDMTRLGDNFKRNTGAITASTSNVSTLSSGFMSARCICHGLEWSGNHIEIWPVTQIYTEGFIRNYDILQFELQS